MTKINIYYFHRILSVLVLLIFLGTASVFAQEGEPIDPLEPVAEFVTLEEPVIKPVVQIKDESNNQQWQASRFETYGIQFVIRAKEALKWALSIEESGFHNPAIEETHAKVLTIANSLFVLGLLAIAGLWMFSAFLSPKKLKRVMMVYAGAVIFVNFALPLNQLLIDGADLLQNTLMTKEDGEIAVTDVVQTPNYEEGLIYQRIDDQNLLLNSSTNTIYLQSLNSDQGQADIPFGRIEKTEQNMIETLEGEPLEELIELNTSETQSIHLNANQPFTITQSQVFNPRTEQSLFTFFILMATGIAYFLVSLVFILRFVILWGFLILSPLLLLLAIFKSTRGWFINWLGLYGRWLLIGPLMALGLSIVINIWRVSGLPVEANLISQQTFLPEGFSNIAFYLPGRTTPNTLGNTTQMMEYIVFLIMLYLPIFFAFALTRQKTINALGSVVVETIRNKESVNHSTVVKQEHHDSETKEKEVKTFMQGVKQSFNQKMNRLAEVALPENKTVSSNHPVTSSKFSSGHSLASHPSSFPLSHPLREGSHETKSSHSTSGEHFSSGNQSSRLVDQWKKALGSNGSMVSRSQMVQNLAFPESAKSDKQRSSIEKVRQDIHHYADQGNQQAVSLIKEVKEVQSLSGNTYTSNNTMIQNNVDRRSYLNVKNGAGQSSGKKQKPNKIPKNLKTDKDNKDRADSANQTDQHSDPNQSSEKNES